MKEMDMIAEILPRRMHSALLGCDVRAEDIEEIRIRRGRQAYIVAMGRSVLINVIASDDEMDQILNTVCRGSLYAYRDSIVRGYIPLNGGIRVGVVGRAGVEHSRITGIYDINEFSIRLPHPIRVECGEVLSLARHGSLLIYSPPGVGKTTLLRELARGLSSGVHALRVAVVDSRDELCFGLEGKSLLLSLLSGYPRRDGIEIAVRTMNAQAIICDEIGSSDDSDAIIEAQGAGIPLIASAHGSGLREMLSHRGMEELHQRRIFQHYVGITRSGERGFSYNVTEWNDANDHI